MHFGRLARPLAQAAVAAVMVATSAGLAGAQGHDDHGGTVSANHKPTPQENALVKTVRDVTDRFKGVTNVEGPGEGYELGFGCVSSGDLGAMGLHYVNMALVKDGEIEPRSPEIILFEPTPGGGIKITGVDYLVDQATWDATHAGPPQLKGQLFHLFDAPNRFGLAAFYTLHVWAWKPNPNGTFANWNPDVSCDAFNARTQNPPK